MRDQWVRKKNRGFSIIEATTAVILTSVFVLAFDSNAHQERMLRELSEEKLAARTAAAASARLLLLDTRLAELERAQETIAERDGFQIQVQLGPLQPAFSGQGQIRAVTVTARRTAASGRAIEDTVVVVVDE